MAYFSHFHFRDYIPASIAYLKSGYSLEGFRRDVGAGVTVGIVALPLAMAFAIASGATPSVGLTTAIIAGFIISGLGGTRFQIGGPTGAFVVIISNVIAHHGFEGLVLATIIAGAMLILMGLFGLGKLLQYIPYPVTTGFTTGIGLLIFISQLKDFLGFKLTHLPGGIIESVTAYWNNAASIHLPTVAIGVVTLVTMLVVRRYIPKIPAPIMGIVIGTLVALVFGIPTETIGTRFGGIPSELPAFMSLKFSDIHLGSLMSDSITIAILAGIESLLSATVADGMSGDRHNPSTELVAQGLANIGSALFGGLPATGAIARTATNIRAGAFSPFAGMTHSLVILLFVLVCAPLASGIPLASLSAVLLVVAWDMSEPHRMLRLFRAPKSDSLVMVMTLGLTVFVDLTVAVEIGVVLAALLFMKRMSELTDIHSLDTGLPEEDVIDRATGNERVVVYEISGPFFFGMAQRFIDIMNFTRKKPELLIFCMRLVPIMDATGIEALETVIRRLQSQGIHVVLSGVTPRVARLIQRLGTDSVVGQENIFPDFSTAIAHSDIAHKDEVS
ncbi:SulP family inorganic anion transporter [Salidesulfovibrio onnuriiensis]|uniref:SulP family inorganic anion transporter n=1 Tax=Salidesulfovibrio onnuriiensis TaxID=2583823 RepID=UPI0011CA787C|nr:SulP family inorganic anion transporter [Salidesulfovibrio onnuriiensis]